MLQIYCPYCEEHREEEEFAYAGEAHITRPLDPEALDDKAWGDYVFFRKNTRGLHHEMWQHAVGCRQYFNATRDTVTYIIHETYKIGEQPQVTKEQTKSVPDKVVANNSSPEEKAQEEKTQEAAAPGGDV